MKVVILAGGFGTRISEESHLKPKPMIEIGEKPILWHIMKLYSHFGFNDFIICLGYKGYFIKEYFAHYFLHESDVTFDFRDNDEKVVFHQHTVEPWQVTLVDTGLETMTGGRVKRIQPYVGDESFMLTYGDGLSNLNIKELVEFHKAHKQIATITAVQPLGRFGRLNLEGDSVSGFVEKPKGDGNWINGGFFVLEPEIFDYIDSESTTIFEDDPLRRLVEKNQLKAFQHNDFWHPMDNLRDKNHLDSLWKAKKAPWKLWD